jgi:DNA (cytosine-5)-methyltransferase 1
MYTLQAGKHHGIANPLGAKKDGGWRGDLDNDTLVTHTLRGEGFDASEDGTGRGTPLVPVAFGGNNTRGPIDVATAVNAHGGPHGRQDFESETFVAFDCKASGRNGFGVGDVSPTLRAMGHADSHQNAGGQVAVAFDTYNQAVSGDQAQTLCSRGDTPGGNAHLVPAIASGVSVRRLTPMECERLQGMPDNHTRISWRSKNPEECPDGPRYKAIGNSWAVPKFRYVGERIEAVNKILNQERN